MISNISVKETGIKPCKILLPNVEDLTAWACVACDQFTGQKDYWERLDEFVGDKKSALRLILPEVFLNDNVKDRIKEINSTINRYLSDGVFSELPEGFILTVRKTPFVEKRIGLIGAIDLEQYDFTENSKALVRATEGTIKERIPPRLKIRENAAAEFPHVMVLFDDERREINEKLYDNRNSLKKLYDFELNMGGGKIEGYFVEKTEAVLESFSRLLDTERLIKKYGKADPFVFAVGDGNHSLATAKEHWNKVKATLSDEEKKTHPARFALAEFVNVYDDGIYFEPIYRFVNGIDVDLFVKGIKCITDARFEIYANGKEVSLGKINDIPDAISKTDEYIKKFISDNGGSVDYIHGKKELFGMVDSDKNSVGICFSKIDKSDLFGYVSKKGAFPKKTFSMGEGIEKRYYLEGKRIS